MSISAEQGVFLWKALRDPTGQDEAVLDKLANIKRVFLNWHTAPDDYIKANLMAIVPMALHDWMVNPKNGKPTKPQSQSAWDFAKRWGLWEKGGPTLLVTDPARLVQTTLTGGLEVNNG